MNDTIFVVMGETGIYDGRNEWIVRAYDNEERAADFVDNLNTTIENFRFSNHFKDFETLYFNREKLEDLEDVMRTLDPHFFMDYTGTRYFYVPVKKG